MNPALLPSAASRRYAASVAFLLLVAAPVLLPPAIAQSRKPVKITGNVVNRDKKPKPFVAVDVLGPSRVFTETNNSGQFTVSVRPGNYVIRVREGKRRMEFRRTVEPKENKPFQLQVAW
jgi:Carboxypeptidase regulatory-like domain